MLATVSRHKAPGAVLLPAPIAAVIRQQASAAFPAEACGLLVGAGRRVCAAVPVPNRATEPDRFEMAPADLFAAHRAARQGGVAVIGHYHSHPNGVAEPSERDRVAVADPSALWVIAALGPTAGTPVGLTAWYPVDYQGDFHFRRLPVLMCRGLKPVGAKKVQDF